MPTRKLIAETDEGRLELHGNELELYDTTGDDPVAIRLRSKNGGIGKVSFDTPDGRGGWTEVGYLFGKLDERGRRDPAHAGKIEFEFWQSGSRDSDGGRLFTVRHDGVRLEGPPSSFLRSPNGRFDVEIQDDGNLVVYDEAQDHRPVWSRFSGNLD